MSVVALSCSNHTGYTDFAVKYLTEDSIEVFNESLKETVSEKVNENTNKRRSSYW